jgi:pimeloyl-ACP methyl ester carboxylesterase
VLIHLQQALDRLCIAAATTSVRSGFHSAEHSREAIELLSRPDFLAPAVPPAALTFSPKSRFTFASPVRTDWDSPVAHGRFRRVRGEWQNSPAVILVHGWNGEMGYYCSFPFIELTLAQFGINAIAFELPFHGRRRPHKPGAIHNLISDDIGTMILGVRQCLADILSVRLWLLEQGCPSVSLWGYSLGGWLAGLLTAHPQPFEAAVLMNPVARMDVAMATLPFAEPAREGLRKTPIDLDLLSLRRLTQTTRRTLIMEGMRDLFVPAETLDDLATHWPNAELWRLKHSHISIVFGALTLLRAVRWLKKEVVTHGH